MRLIIYTALLISLSMMDLNVDLTHAITDEAAKIPPVTTLVVPKALLGLDNPSGYLPSDNALTEFKVRLGRFLFFDKRLSRDGTVACASCHLIKAAYADNRAVSKGVDGLRGNRNAPSIINRIYGKQFFWDGRAATLEEQSLEPLVNPIEHGFLNYQEVVNRLRRIGGYRKLFRESFQEDITIEGVGMALASFQRTILSGNSPVDRFDYGVDSGALTASAQRGFRVFRGKGRCIRCHAGPNYTDEQFHNLGVGWESSQVDLGRYAVTHRPEDIGAFKTPTLREIARTGPYMHDGRFKTLRAVVNFYNHGAAKNPFQDSTIGWLFLSDEERADLVEFLKSLSGDGWQQMTPPTSFPK